MNVIKSQKENGDTILRVSTKINTTHNRHGAYLVSPKGIFRMYYTDNQKRFPVLQEVFDI